MFEQNRTKTLCREMETHTASTCSFIRRQPSRFIVFGLAMVFSLAGCGPEEMFVDETRNGVGQPYHSGWGPLRGHEDITRFGIDLANLHILTRNPNVPSGSTDWPPSQFFPPVEDGENGISSNHPIVKGNFETDFPGDKMLSAYGLKSDKTWHTAFELQTIHALRRHNGTTVESAFETCERVKILITRTTKRALQFIRYNRDKYQGLYWIGHATHIIQDSFSDAHAPRTNNYLNITDHCTYGKSFPGVCYHHKVSEDDRVWRKNVSCQINPRDRDWHCLKDNAKAAAKATASYLCVVARLIKGLDVSVERAMSDYFNATGPNNDIPHVGYFVCPNGYLAPADIPDPSGAGLMKISNR